MRPQICPGSTPNDSESKATMPPNRTPKSSTSRSATCIRPPTDPRRRPPGLPHLGKRSSGARRRVCTCLPRVHLEYAARSMSDGRSAMRMTDDEVAAFLEEGRRVHVATHGPGQAMHLVPLSYVMIDGRLTLWTDGDSQKVANLRRDPRVTCLVEMGDRFEDMRAVQIRGRAEVADDLDTSVKTGLALFARSGSEGQSEQAQAYARSLAPIRVTVTIEPERVISWDHRKLTGVRPDEIGT